MTTPILPESTTLRRWVLGLTATLTLLLAPAVLLAQAAASVDTSSRDLARVAPKEVGMSQDGLDKLNAAMHQIVDDGELAGVMTVVARHGKIVNWDVYGKRDLESGAPLEADTIHRIYSMTKPIVGVALMTLYEEGKFTLDDPVEKFLPQFKDMVVAAGEADDGSLITEPAKMKMTIRQLMNHTGGLTYGLFSRTPVDLMYGKMGVLDRDSSLAEMTEKLGKIPLMSQPGTKWQYSVSVDVQGYLIEVLTGKKLDQVLEERIFEPLGMVDTAFWVEPKKVSRFAKLYVPDKDGKLMVQPEDEYLTKPGLLSGGGGLVSTAMDYTRFAQMLGNGGELDGVRILKPETVKLMATNHLPDSLSGITFFPSNTFGLDFSIVNEPSAQEHALSKSEFWWFGIGGTWFGVNPTQDLVIVGMIQNRGGAGANKARMQSKMLAYEAILDPAPVD